MPWMKFEEAKVKWSMILTDRFDLPFLDGFLLIKNFLSGLNDTSGGRGNVGLVTGLFLRILKYKGAMTLLTASFFG